MKYLAIIPARSGSKTLPNKNIYPFGNQPLIYWTIQAALKSKLCDVVVTTDSENIEQVIKNRNYPIRIVKRPDYLCEDTTPLAPVIAHAYRQINNTYSAIITLQPTSPLRNSIHIIEAISRFEINKADSLLSVVEDYHSIWEKKPTGELIVLKERLFNRQQEKPAYIANGAIFITATDILLNKLNRLGGKIEIYIMDKKSSLDIHTIDDIELAEWYLQKRGKSKNESFINR